MNEAAAKMLWCPFSVVRNKDAGTATNRFTGRDDHCRCLGTGCAVWRGTAQSGRCGLASDKDAP
jgi:hypothetical protein